MVRFSVNPTPKQGPSKEPFAPQLALARVHPCLVPLERAAEGYAIPSAPTRGWFELRANRGLAGYGLARALRILLDALAGLSALEDTRNEAGQPFVHGELVPAMLRVDHTGTTRLLPLAPWHWSKSGTLPAPERCGHLAPERLLGDAIDPRADVFSAGVLLWEALAGRRLFETESVDGIVMRLLGDKVNLPQLPPELSWAVPLKAVAMCALSVDPEQRFANCSELAEAIEAVAGDRVATHADVTHYFRSVIARPPSLPTHHSSLSALVAPVRPSKPVEPTVEPTPSEAVARDSVAPAPRAGRPLWAIAAVSCTLSALVVSAVARFHTAHDERHSAARSAPALGAPLPTVAPPTSATLAPSPSAAPSTAASAVSNPIETDPKTALEPAIPPADGHDRASKAQKGSSSKGTTLKPRAPAKAGRPPLAAAAKYGI